MEIVEKCKGVPLALKVIAKLLFKRTEGEWLRVKNNVSRYITQQENGILPILKLSYDHLPPHLRQCFAYCSLIPKDTVFGVKQLIRCWMAQGFIQSLSGDEDLEDAGHEYFKDLLWRSFFEVEEIYDRSVSRFRMHDLMHDLACSVAGTEYCIAGLKAENVNERTRHVTFEDKLPFSWEIPNTVLKANRVRSFLLIRRYRLNLSTSIVVMSNFKYLRMLDLSSLHIERLPHSIGNLKHLKALYLSRNNIKTLPSSLSRLQNLQILDLDWCINLENLPRKTSRLVSLKHLQIQGCHGLAYMPHGLGQLTCLQTLSKFVVGKIGREVGQLRELNRLNKLEVLGISALKNAIAERGSTYLKDKQNLKSLELFWSREEDDEDDGINVEDEMVFECLQPHPNLKKLEVVRYPGSKISSWLSSVTNLTELILLNCAKCKHLPPLDQLCYLKVLELYELEALENVSDIKMQKELSSAELTTIFFPSLEKLLIYNCRNLKGWWRSDVDETSNALLPCFPCLSHLYIGSCPNLTSMPLFPSVKNLSLRKTSSKPLRQTMKLKSATSEAPSSSSSSSIFHPFSKLETLKLEDIKDLDSMPSLHQLSSLKILGLRKLKALENVFEIEKLKQFSSAELTILFFPSLEDLHIEDCPNLKGWWRNDVGEASNPHLCYFPCLADLSIVGCPNLISMPLFPSVRKLSLGKTKWKPLIQPTMKMKRTTSEAPTSSSSSSSSIFPLFSKLNSVRLEEIEDIDSLQEEFLQNLPSLRCLDIYGCINLKSMPEGMHRLTSLTSLTISNCPQLSERCQRDIGVDWPNIAHIKTIFIDGRGI